MHLQDLMRKKILNRRSALKGSLLGAAAMLPIVGNVPGVSAASLGTGQADVKVQPLTGKTLQQELKKLQAKSVFKRAEAYLSQKGFAVTDTLAEGYYLYQKTGTHWSRETILTVSYTGTSETATVTFGQTSQASTLDIIIANPQTKSGTAYIVHENGTIETVATLSANAQELAIAQQYQNAVQTNAVQPQASVGCWLCRAVCSALVGTGCSILGAAFTCGRICLPFGEDPPCLAVCAVAYRLVCAAAGNFDCYTGVCVLAVHAC